jgi:hypothetical protein
MPSQWRAKEPLSGRNQQERKLALNKVTGDQLATLASQLHFRSNSASLGEPRALFSQEFARWRHRTLSSFQLLRVH